MKTRIISVLLLIAFVCFAEAIAQEKKPVKRAAKTRASQPVNKTRVRRTVDPALQTTEPQAVVPPEQKAKTPVTAPISEAEKTAAQPKAPSEQAQQEQKSTEKVEQPPNEPKDPIALLRDQIDAATTGADRNRLRLQLAEELVNEGKQTEALSELHSIVGTDVFDPEGLYNTGNSLARLGDTEGAVEAYRKAIEQRKGRYSRAFNNLGVVLLRSGRWDEAYNALLSALKLEGFRYAEASYNLGRLYAARGENDLAVREWKRALAVKPDHTAAAEALARIGSEGRVRVETTRSTTSRSSEKPKTTSASSNTASTDRSTSVTPAATASAPSKISLILDPVSFDLLQRARNESEKGKTPDAINTYKRLLSRERGYFAPVNLELSFALLSAKRDNEALDNLEMVANRDGGLYPISYYHLARIYESRSDLKRAETWFSAAAAAFGALNPQFLLDVSRVREKQLNFQGALESMERYLSILQQQGQQPTWSSERVTALRQKIAAAPKR